jgi:putative flippase GtrA
MIDIIKFKKIFFTVSFLKFIIVGMINTFSSFILYVILIRNDINYFLAIILSYFWGIIISYILNTIFVFNVKKINNILKFLVSYLSALLLNIIIVYIGVRYFFLGKVLMQFIATLICLVYNYLIQKNWVFKKEKN